MNEYRVAYEVQPRRSPGQKGSTYAVRRRGSRGGLKTVAVYSDSLTAARVCRELNSARVHEIGA